MFEPIGRSLGMERAWQTQDLEGCNRELQAANEELEAFAYSASHGLRTPARHVKGFTEMGRHYWPSIRYTS